MNHYEIDFMVTMERRRDELAEAEHSRLVRLALESRPNPSTRVLPSNRQWLALFNRLVSIMGQGMVMLGVRLSSWGCRLQVHYANPVGNQQATPCD